jgi:pimeloyl-ACP methyl ester carboxylesterase
MLSILNDVHEKLAEIKCPIKIIAGKEDKVCSSAEQISLCKEKAPESEIIEIENGGHALPFTHSEECAKIIKSMIS